MCHTCISMSWMCSACRHSAKLAAAAAALLLLVLGMAAEPKTGFEPDAGHSMSQPATLFIGVVLLSGLLQPLLPALVVLMATTAQLGSAWAHAASSLSRPPFLSFADITYDIYLLHPLVRLAPCPMNTVHAACMPVLQSSSLHLLESTTGPSVTPDDHVMIRDGRVVICR